MQSWTPVSLDVVRQYWPLSALEVISLHQSVPTRVVAHVMSDDGELAVKVDAQPHVSVLGGELVQAHVAALAPCLAPVPRVTRAGALAASVGGLRYTVTPWVHGTTPDDEPETWWQVGTALARLHGLPLVERPFAIPISGVCEEVTAQQEWPRDLVREVVGRANKIAFDPLAVVHGQPSPANMVQRSDGGITLLDWDESGTGPSVLDLGYPRSQAVLPAPVRCRKAGSDSTQGA